MLPWASLLVFLALPVQLRAWRSFNEPKPAESPVPNPVWPLWFAANAFLVTRRAGGLLALGLLIGAFAKV